LGFSASGNLAARPAGAPFRPRRPGSVTNASAAKQLVSRCFKTPNPANFALLAEKPKFLAGHHKALARAEMDKLDNPE
jgi:hypothetical protein